MIIIVGPALQQLAAVHDKGAGNGRRIDPFAVLRADRQTRNVVGSKQRKNWYRAGHCEVGGRGPETGVVEIVRYTLIDDCGRAVDPMLIHGQSRGGIAQGIGQALWEECFYDRDTAQLLSGSLMDYALPRADNLPLFQTGQHFPSHGARAPAREKRPGIKGRGRPTRSSASGSSG